MGTPHPPGPGTRRRLGIAAGFAAALAVALVAWLIVAPVSSAAAAGAGTYTVTNAGSNLCLALPSASSGAGVQLQQSGCAGGGGQQWTFTAVSGGFRITSVATGLCAGVRDASSSAGKAIEQQACTGATSQTWTQTASGSNYRLVNANGGRCMNTADNSTAAGAPVQTNSCDSVATKQWTLTATSGSSPTPTPTSPSPTPTVTQSPPSSSALYVAPNGSAGAAGTVSAPTTLDSAITRITSGGSIYLRGGTYNYPQTITVQPGNNGTSSARTLMSAYPGETPVLNFSAQAEDSANRGLQLNGNYWHVYGITVQDAGDNGIFVGGSNNVIERTVTRGNHDTGLQLSRIASTTPQSQWPSNNLVIRAESYDNADSGGENADGFAAKLTVGTGNVFQYDVSHNNIDDGWDMYTKTDTGPIGPVTIEDSLSYNQGTLTNGTSASNGDRNGFKLGGDDIAVNHTFLRNIAVGNGHHGITYNDNPGTLTISNNVSIDNADSNFYFPEGSSVFRNNTSCRFNVSGSNDKIVGNTDSSNQWWTGTNGSRCATYAGAVGWSFASDGHLVVTFGGNPVTP
jgi:hypothetical protein